MDDSWLAKCVATPPPTAPLPAPAPALTPAFSPSSIPTSAVQPQQLRRVPDSTSSDQVYMNLRHNFRSFIRQEGLAKDQARVQETAANSTLQLGSNIGKGELGNSFLALLSAEFSQLANSRMDITKLSVGNDDKFLNGNGSVVPSITIPPLPENHRGCALGNWNELSSFVGSRTLINPVPVEVPSLPNNPGAASISNNDVDFVELAPDQTCQGNHAGIAASPTMSGWSKSGWSANANKHPPMDVQASRIISFETISPISHNSSILRGRPLVFCRNTVGELFTGDRGILGVICFCHSSRMSVAKFCEHSGSSSLNPGEAVYLENGMSISHWCKENLGIIAPGDSNGWEWFGGSFTKGVLVGSKASDAPTLLNNTGSISNLGSPIGSRSSAEAFNNFLSNHPYLKSGCTVQEKSGTNVQDCGYQSYNVSGNNPFQEKIPNAMQVSMPDQSMNQFMQAMKQGPLCVSPEKAHSTLRKGKKVVDHHANTFGIYHTVKCADRSVPLTPLWANKAMKHGFGIRSSNAPAEAPLTDRDGASNIELRLGQPSKKSHPLAGPFPTPVFKFEPKFNSLKSQVQQQVKEPISNSWDAKKTRENLHFTPLEASCSNKRLVQVVTNTLTSSVNTVKHSGAGDLTRDANKNPLISLFLSHLEGNNTSLSLDNLFNNNDQFSSRMADTASTLTKSTFCDSGVGSHGIERKSDSSNSNKGKNVLLVGSGRVNSDFLIKNNQTPDTRELPGPFSRKKCRSVSGEGNQVSSFLDQPPNMLQKLAAKGAREPGKFSFLSNNDDFDHVAHESSVPVHCGSVGPDLLKGFPMNLSPTTLCTSEPNRNSFSTTQHFMDANLRSIPSKPMVEFSNQENSQPFLKTTTNHHKLCCLSSSQLQDCQDTLAMQRDSREGSYCRSHCDDSQITGRAVYSCPSCRSSCGMDIFSTHPCHAGSTRSCNCTGPVKRHLNSEKCCNRFSSCCSCDADEQPCLRLAMPANSHFPAGRKHEMFNHKEHTSCLSGHCCSSLFPRCIQSERGVCGQSSITHATLDHDKDSLLPDIKQICLSHCDCCKNNVISRNDQQTTFWKDVPKKVFAHPDASSVKFAKALENAQNVGDQVVDCAARFSRTHQTSKSLRAKQASNVSSGSSTPVVTEISVEANKLMSCTTNTRSTKIRHDFLVDEGSGNEICGSSDEAICGVDGGDEGPHLIGKIDMAKPGLRSLEGHSSHQLDEFPLKNSLKAKRVKYVNEELAGQEIINHKKKCDRTPKAASRNEFVELNRSDKSVLVLDFSPAPSELPNNIGHVEVNSYQSQEIELSPQPGSVMQSAHGSACGSSSVKRKRSALSLNKSNERFNNQHKLMENDDRQSLNGDCSDCIPGISREKKDITAGSKQDNFISTGKPPKYMSLNCIVNTPNNGKITLPKKSRPTVCGNSGIISTEGTFGPQKPAKMISLSLILRKTRRCTEINDTAIRHDSKLSSCKLLLEKDVNGKNPKILVPEENKECSTKNAEYLSASSMGKEIGPGNNINTKVLQKADENKEYPSKNSASLTSSTMTGPGRNLGLGSHHMKIVVHSRRKQKDLRTCQLSKLTSKRKHATKSTNLSTSEIDECSNLIQAKNQQNDSPSATMELEDKKLHLIEVKLHQSEPFESTVPTLIGSSPDPVNNQDHAGKLSQVSRRRDTRGCKCPSFLLNSDAFCCVCGSSNQEDANQLLECHDCLIRVHQACYGISKIPKGYWSCRPCKSNSQNIVCVLCGYGGGAMTRALKSQNIIKSLLKAWRVAKQFHSLKSIFSRNTENGSFNLSSADEATKLDKFGLVNALGEMISDTHGAPLELDLQQTNTIECKIKTSEKSQADNSIIAGLADPSIIQWVHMVCGLWTPGTRCPNVVTMNTFDVSGALPAKKNAVCSICSRPGGSCIECRVPSCSILFHPWCAHQKGLLQSETEGADNEKVGFYGRCLHHATHYSFHLDNHVMVYEESPRDNERTCARTEGFRGRQRERGQQFNPQKPYDGVCIVSQEQINVWLHINGPKSYPRNAAKSPSSDVEYDFRKEYIRYEQSKGWKHLVVYKSGIHALGLYTSQFIARGAMVVEYVGEIVGLRVADKREVEYQSGRRIQYKSACYFFRIDKEHIIDATRKGGIARFVNHSCLPNCVAKVISVRNEKKVVFFAERDINPGEEITYDYHFNSEDEGKKIPCFCNSRNCRRYLN